MEVPTAAPVWLAQLREVRQHYPSAVRLAADLGVSDQSVAGWLSGKRSPQSAGRRRIAELYERHCVPADLALGALILARQSLDGVLEMTTVAEAHTHAARCLRLIGRYIDRLPASAVRPESGPAPAVA